MARLRQFSLGVAQFSCNVGDPQANLDQMADRIAEAPRDTAVLMFPELALTGYTVAGGYDRIALRLNREGRLLRQIRQLSHETALVVGFVEETDEALFYNSVGFWYRGELLGLHRKVYPPNYGGFDEGKWFARGKEVRAFDTPWGRFAMLICADAWHPSLPYLAAHDGADVLLSVAASSLNSVRPDMDTLAGWHRLNQTQALTLSCYVAFANHCGAEGALKFTGGSQVVEPRGECIASLSDRPGLTTASIDPAVLRRQRIALPFRRDDDLMLTAEQAQQIAARKQQNAAIPRLPNPAPQRGAVRTNDAASPILARIGPEGDDRRAQG